MFQTNRLTVLVPDNAVYTDVCCILNLDLSNAGIPENVRCLQWLSNAGHIEYNDGQHNTEIVELPAWANSCLEIWEESFKTNAPSMDDITSFMKNANDTLG
jgi:hypothetical protein